MATSSEPEAASRVTDHDPSAVGNSGSTTAGRPAKPGSGNDTDPEAPGSAQTDKYRSPDAARKPSASHGSSQADNPSGHSGTDDSMTSSTVRWASIAERTTARCDVLIELRYPERYIRPSTPFTSDRSNRSGDIDGAG